MRLYHEGLNGDSGFAACILACDGLLDYIGHLRRKSIYHIGTWTLRCMPYSRSPKTNISSLSEFRGLELVDPGGSLRRYDRDFG